MNAYYTKRIKGQHTRPHEIGQALRKDFSKDAKLAAKQRLAVAHIEAAAAVEQRYRGERVGIPRERNKLNPSRTARTGIRTTSGLRASRWLSQWTR